MQACVYSKKKTKCAMRWIEGWGINERAASENPIIILENYSLDHHGSLLKYKLLIAVEETFKQRRERMKTAFSKLNLGVNLVYTYIHTFTGTYVILLWKRHKSIEKKPEREYTAIVKFSRFYKRRWSICIRNARWMGSAGVVGGWYYYYYDYCLLQSINYGAKST